MYVCVCVVYFMLKPTPPRFQSTYNFVHAQLLDASGLADEHTMRLVYAMAFVRCCGLGSSACGCMFVLRSYLRSFRFINGFSDLEQKGTHARSVQSISTSLSIPGIPFSFFVYSPHSLPLDLSVAPPLAFSLFFPFISRSNIVCFFYMSNPYSFFHRILG